ncbi:MAG: hypothetical protein H0W58_08315 [Acidobacteria bacterium]|nr:hypothetical protein [Acidobacteriota bacterium]
MNFTIFNLRKLTRRLLVSELAIIVLTIFSLSGALFLSGKASAQTPTPTPVGEDDPMVGQQNYTLFRNDNFFIAGNGARGQDPAGLSTPGYINHTISAYGGTGFYGFNLTGTTAEPPDANYGFVRTAGGSGRIVKPDAEQGVIYKLINYDGNPYYDGESISEGLGNATYYFQLFDKSGVIYGHTFPAARANLASHLDVAVGDLDNLRNANSEYHDEVVLVSENNTRMQLSVLDFRNSATDPQITTIDGGLNLAYYWHTPSPTFGYVQSGQISCARVADYRR